MSDHRVDEAKGRVKEAAGALTNNSKLEREGERDQAAASIKKNVEKGLDTVKETVEGAIDSVKNAITGK